MSVYLAARSRHAEIRRWPRQLCPFRVPTRGVADHYAGIIPQPDAALAAAPRRVINPEIDMRDLWILFQRRPANGRRPGERHVIRIEHGVIITVEDHRLAGVPLVIRVGVNELELLVMLKRGSRRGGEFRI